MYSYRSQDFDLLAPWLRRLFLFLRFACLFVLAVLLLEPLIKTITTKVEKPVVLVVLDQSQSMVLSKDSASIRSGIEPAIEKLRDELGDDFRVDIRGFDDDLSAEVNYDFKGPVTDLGKSTASIASSYAESNLGAIVMLSDGILNRGESPVYNLNQIKAPVYTVAYGDTTPKIDAAISALNANRTAFKGNEFPVIAGVKISKLKGQQGKIEIRRSGKVLASQTFAVTNDNFGKEFSFILKADAAGIQQYTVVVSTFAGETVLQNNSRSFFIDVIENREKILLLYAHLHPDVSAISRSIESIENYELQVVEAQSFAGNIADYSLVIFHQTGPADVSQKKVLDAVQRLSKPLWLFLGPNSDWSYINQAGYGVKLSGASGLTQVQGRINESFQLFAGDLLNQKQLFNLPPVAVPFGELTCAPSINALYYQQVELIATQVPLFGFGQSTAGRRAFFFGEGIWRWRIALFAEEQSHEAFNGLVSRAVQYLTAQGNKQQLVVNTSKYYNAADDAVLGAELYNDAGQFVAGQEINFELTYNDSVKYKYAFNKGAVGYDLPLGNLPSGKYAYTASAVFGGKNLSAAGKFIVESSDLEAASTTADHNLLFQVASGSGGKMIYPLQLDQLAELIRKNPVVKPVSYSTNEVSDAIKMKWIFFTIMLLISTEWFLRKRNGLY